MSGDEQGPVWTIIVAAGSGARFGAQKQFLDLGGERVVDRSVATAARHSAGVVLVVPVGPQEATKPAMAGPGVELRVVTGADTRSGSVRCGLAVVPEDAAIVLVHDGARPLATDALFARVIDAVRAGADAVAPVVPVADSLRFSRGGALDRADVVAVQTPQGFPAETLRKAYEAGMEATDDLTVVENGGGRVVLVDGDRRNLKLTTALDLEIARVLLDTGSDS